jgi:hypothetical protein
LTEIKRTRLDLKPGSFVLPGVVIAEQAVITTASHATLFESYVLIRKGIGLCGLVFHEFFSRGE